MTFQSDAFSGQTPAQATLDYCRVEKALRFLHANYQHHPSLKETAAHVHLSEYHFERLFQRWAGTSPKRFLQFLTLEHVKPLLRSSHAILDATHDAGLSGAGRLHDLFVSCEAVTPGAYKARGKGIGIRYGIHATPFGDCLLALTDRGICALRFISGGSTAGEIAALKAEWSGADFVPDPVRTGGLARRLFLRGKQGDGPFHLHLRGTNFQLKVWQALLSVPSGALVTYSGIAALIGSPKSARAIGTAVGKNPVGFLIPCHRVIQSLGTFGNYRWGIERKEAIIGWEAAQRNGL